MSELLLDRAGRRRSPATLPGFHAGHAPGNKGVRYPADPPKVEEIIAVMRTAGDGTHGRRLRGLVVIMWRGGLRIQEALALTEGDLDQRRGSLLVRRGKGGRRREVGMDAWGWEQLQPWLDLRRELPVGPLLCVINGTKRGRHWSSAAARAELRRTAAAAGVRRRVAPHQLRHAHAVEMAREGVPLIVIQRQLGHSTSASPPSTCRDRQRRDHRNRARPTRAHDSRQRLAAALTDRGRDAARRAKRERLDSSAWITRQRAAGLTGAHEVRVASRGQRAGHAPFARCAARRYGRAIRTAPEEGARYGWQVGRVERAL
jgi:Phage integrase family